MLSLGCLVNARRSLYQSKPSIEASEATTLSGARKRVGTVARPNIAATGGDVRRPVMPPRLSPRATYLSHRAKYVPTPRLVGRKPHGHGDFRHLDLRGLGRPTAELAGFAPNSAPGPQNACKQGGSWDRAGESKRGVDGT